MFFIRLYNFICGYAVIKITGAKPERFINILMGMGIKFWGMEKTEKTEETELHIKLASRYAKAAVLNEAAAKTHTQCEIISKKGVRYFIERRKYRLGIYAGAIIGVALIYISTFFIWDVKIVKSDYHNDYEIIEMLETLGCRTGVLKKSLDIIEIQNRAILASNGKILWIAVNIEGTVASVEVKKRDPATAITDRKTPVNIIASKSGKIISIDTYEGQQAAEREQTISKGDLLISGTVDSAMLGVRIEHASGKVLAETTRIIEVVIPLDSIEKYYTGNKINKKSLNILSKNVNLYLKGNIPFEKYDKIKDMKNITLFNSIVLPVKISTSSYDEFEYKIIKIDENTAKDIAISKINGIIESRFGGDKNIDAIKSTVYEGEIKDDYYYMKCTVECIENIAKEMPFETNING